MIRKSVHSLFTALVVVFFAGSTAKAQEFPWTMQYVNNMYTINPAFVGMWDQAGFFVSTRKDYTTIKGSTLYQQFSYHSPIKDHESGFGADLIRRDVGYEKRLIFTGDYSYQVRLDMYNYLRFGLKAGFVNYSNNLTDYQLYPDRIYDSQFNADLKMYFMTAFGVGAVIFSDNYYISLSVPQVINNTFKVNRTGYSSLQEFKTAYLSAGYAFKLHDKSIILKPNLLIIGTVGKPVYFDASANLYLPANLQLGLNLRSNGAACLSAQFTFPNSIRIGFAADYAIIQDIRKFQAGTYEILVGYDFNIYRKKDVRPNYF